MANILISSLGTGDRTKGYYSAKYEYKGVVKETKVIAKALVEFLDIDRLYMVGTRGSYWDNCYVNFGGTDEDYEMKLYEKMLIKDLEEKDLEQLAMAIDGFTATRGSKCFLIEYGINQDELWGNFEQYLQILERLEDGDELYIDITHSFRSLALMSFLMVQFGQVVRQKKFKVSGILYGMSEYRFENGGISPIVDLKIFYDLMEWIKAIDAFKNHSRSDLIEVLLRDDEGIREITKDTFGGFDVNVSFASMTSLKKFVSNAAKSLEMLKKSNSPIVRLLSNDILEFVSRLNQPETSKFQLELAKWYVDSKNYALAFLVLTEALVSKECENQGLKVTQKNHRAIAKEALYSRKDNDKAGKTYHTISRIRNAIAHQTGKSIDIQREVHNLSNYLETVENFIKK